MADSWYSSAGLKAAYTLAFGTKTVHIQKVSLVDSAGAAVSPVYAGPLAAQLPATLGIKTSALSLSVAPSSDGVFPVTGTFWQATQPVSGTFFQATQPVSLASVPAPVGVAYTDRSITNLAGTSEQLMAANASRHTLVIHNIGATAIAVNLTGGTASLTVGGSVVLAAAASLILDSSPPVGVITVIGTATADVTAYEG